MAKQLSIQIDSIARREVDFLTDPPIRAHWIASGEITDRPGWRATVILGNDEFRRVKQALLDGQRPQQSILEEDVLEITAAAAVRVLEKT